MKKITKKLLFDLVMAFVWVILMIYSLTGAFWHEVLGLGVLGLFAIHILYNIPKIKKEIPRMFSPGKRSLTLRYGVDFMLLVSGFFTGISGVLISKETLTFLDAANIPLWTTLHVGASYIALGLIALHIGQHLKTILAVAARPFHDNPSFRRVIRSAWNVVIVGVVVYGFIAGSSLGYEGSAVLAASAGGQDAVTGDARTESQDTAASGSLAESAAAVPTLSEFLSGLCCTACHRNCPLTAPQCGRADEQINSAEDEYMQLYGSVADLSITVGGIDYSSNLS